MKGVGYELGKELGRRMGVPYEPVIYQTPKLLVEDVNSGKRDISFIGQDPDRRKNFGLHCGLSQARAWISCAEWLNNPDDQ
jgi:polar amino acid transport system substrate-binding protein